MPIVDNVLVGEGTVGEFPYPDESLGDYFEEIVKKNLASRGDAAWLVSIYLPVIFSCSMQCIWTLWGKISEYSRFLNV